MLTQHLTIRLSLVVSVLLMCACSYTQVKVSPPEQPIVEAREPGSKCDRKTKELILFWEREVSTNFTYEYAMERLRRTFSSVLDNDGRVMLRIELSYPDTTVLEMIHKCGGSYWIYERSDELSIPCKLYPETIRFFDRLDVVSRIVWNSPATGNTR
jgi:hypothetical protein